MASKKETEQDKKEAEKEAQLASMQNNFLHRILAPAELIAAEDLPMSPTVELPEDYVETPHAPLQPKKAPTPQVEPQLYGGELPNQAGSPEPASPVLETKTVQPPAPKDEEPEAPKPALGPTEFLLSGMLPSEPTNETSPQKTESPEEKKEPVQATPPASKEEGQEEDGESGGKGGMLSKAKSLFANITKKDKK